MTQVSLRSWQREALEKHQQARNDSFLAVACPGAGKTTFALAAARQYLRGRRLPVVVVVPTAHLKAQWAEAAVSFGLHLDPAWTVDAGMPGDMHGIIVTYSQASNSDAALRRISSDGFVILDEIHHAASDRTWGDGVEIAFADAARRLLLSGTPFRSDDMAIPFVQYSFGDYGDALADYEYGYGEALEDGGVVRPVFFPRFDGHMEWINSAGEQMDATFEDELSKSEWGARLRTALSVEGQWLPTVLDHAQKRLTEVRREHAAAGGLVIATDHEHAKGIAKVLRTNHGVNARIALSDDPAASDIISGFATGTDEWIIAVRMISEGVDIPRLRVAVFATTTTTALFFRQAVGRIARWTPGLAEQRAYMYLPDDLRLRSHATTVAQQRRHSIGARTRRQAEDGELDPLHRPERAEEQMSLFAAVSSSVLTETETRAPTVRDGLDPDEPIYAVTPGDAAGFNISLPPPPPLPGRGTDGSGKPLPEGLGALRTRRAQKAEMRERNADRVRTIVHMGGLGHAQVNRELNRLSGIDRIDDATIIQLEVRVGHAQRWIDQLGGR